VFFQFPSSARTSWAQGSSTKPPLAQAPRAGGTGPGFCVLSIVTNHWGWAERAIPQRHWAPCYTLAMQSVLVGWVWVTLSVCDCSIACSVWKAVLGFETTDLMGCLHMASVLLLASSAPHLRCRKQKENPDDPTCAIPRAPSSDLTAFLTSQFSWVCFACMTSQVFSGASRCF
jgi:hypothetical protein